MHVKCESLSIGSTTCALVRPAGRTIVHQQIEPIAKVAATRNVGTSLNVLRSFRGQCMV